MTDAESSRMQPQSSAQQARDVAAAALVLSAGSAEISAEAEERDRTGSDPHPDPSGAGVRPRARTLFVLQRRGTARGPRAISASEPASVSTQQTPIVGTPDDAGEESRPETR